MRGLHIVKNDNNHSESKFFACAPRPAPSHVGSLHLESYHFHAPDAGCPARPVHLCATDLAAAGTSHGGGALRMSSASGTENPPSLPLCACPAPPQSSGVHSYRQPRSQPVSRTSDTGTECGCGQHVSGFASCSTSGVLQKLWGGTARQSIT